MKLHYTPLNLQLKHTFAIANYARTFTPIVLVELHHQGVVGYGEAALPQYLGETQESVCAFLSQIDCSLLTIDNLDHSLRYIDSLAQGNTAAKAAIDIALHDVKGKLKRRTVGEIYGIDPTHTPLTSYTIGIDSDEVIRQKVAEAAPYAILKVKVDNENWHHLVTTIRSISDKPLYIDANQSWSNREQALKNIEYLQTQNVVLVEQPFEKHNLDDSAWLSARSPLPIIADESVQRLSDIERIHHAFNGINIKLMKCTGIAEAYQMIGKARALNLKVMLGCMTETSCAISAAAQLSPLVDYADLDGNLLISNDPFRGVSIECGRIVLPRTAGIGITKR